jgi:hypothetical protein
MRVDDALERHGGVHRDEAGDRAHAEGDAAGQRLSRARAALHELLERGVRRETDGRIGALPHHLQYVTRRMGRVA